MSLSSSMALVDSVTSSENEVIDDEEIPSLLSPNGTFQLSSSHILHIAFCSVFPYLLPVPRPLPTPSIFLSSLTLLSKLVQTLMVSCLCLFYDLPRIAKWMGSGYGASTCGYCGKDGERSKEESSLSYGMVSEQLSPRMYQRLIDRGWRRSGTYIYHPDMSQTCCPQYTIRLNAMFFDPGKDKKLRKVMGRWQKWVMSGERGEDKGKGKSQPKPSTSFDYLSELHSPEYRLASTSSSPPAHKYTVSLLPSAATPERFSLYNRYQMSVHGDAEGKNSVEGFRRFLCDNPLGVREPSSQVLRAVGRSDVRREKRQRIPYSSQKVIPDHLPTHYGCYHQLHYIDGTLIAFSVLDILPGGVSSVYFVWHPEYAWASLGKLSAIREAALAREMAEVGMKDVGWLYMGFYIHSCHKMRYKGDYKPSQLLDPGTNIFHPIEKVVPILEANPRGYHPFDQPPPDSDIARVGSHKTAPSLPDGAVANVGPSDSNTSLSPTTSGSAGSAKKKRKIRRHTDWPDESPPSFADPGAFDDATIKSLLVVLNGDMVLPLSRVPFRNAKYAERTVRELVAAVGIDTFASTSLKEKNVFVSF